MSIEIQGNSTLDLIIQQGRLMISQKCNYSSGLDLYL